MRGSDREGKESPATSLIGCNVDAHPLDVDFLLSRGVYAVQASYGVWCILKCNSLKVFSYLRSVIMVARLFF